MKYSIVATDSYTAGLSSFSYIKKVLFFEDLNVVVTLTRYEDETVRLSDWYGNVDNFDKIRQHLLPDSGISLK
jgi:hypothetical protein